jgi:hypothetical protein
MACLLAILAIAGIRYYLMELRVEPAALITETIAKAQQARSYRYQLQSEWINGTGRRPISQVAGERADGSYHFKGTIMGTPLELYQIGSRSYTLDPVNKQWYILDGTDMRRQQIYYAEIDPLSNFQFKSIASPRVVGTDRVNGRKCWVVEFQPEIDSQYLELWWRNYTCRLWVEKAGHTLAMGMVAAESKNSPGAFLNMTVTFQDFNRKIVINPPQ